MSLPQKLQRRLTEHVAKQTSTDIFLSGFNAGALSGNAMRDTLSFASKKGVSHDKLARDILQWFARIKYRPTAPSYPEDQLTRVEATVYLGIVRPEYGADHAQFRQVRVPRYFVPRLKQWNEQREKSDLEALNLRDRINEFRGRVYSSRTFSVTLKAVIFERDNYTCRLCLRDREILQTAGLHLECDHILAWEDGGLTSYDNGQTVCSECNKAKHHAKRYLGLVSRLHGGQSQK